MACRTFTQASQICTRVSSGSAASPILPFLAPAIFTRHASAASKGKSKSSGKKGETKVRKKLSPEFKREPLKFAKTFSLCDAMRYLRAFEVGQNPTVPKYELAVSLRTSRNGTVIRNQMKFPHGFSSAQRVAVICPPNSPAEQEAREAGASIVGEDILIDQIKQGIIEFDKLFCHPDSLGKLQKANVGRILGPKGLMPSEKTKTVVTDVKNSLRARVGGVDYREKAGVIRLAIGQIGFSPNQMEDNIKAFMNNVKKDCERAQEKITKDIHEVVLSSTHGPGFPLDRTFRSEGGITPDQLTVF